MDDNEDLPMEGIKKFSKAIEPIDRWSRKHDGFVRFVEVAVIAVAGIVVAVGGVVVAIYQYRVDERSLDQYVKTNELTEANLKLVQKQLALTEKQTKLAEREFFPDFRFSYKEGQSSGISVVDALKRVRSLNGTAKIYFELKDRNGEARRIAVDNFFNDSNYGPKQLDEALTFYHYPGLDRIEYPMRSSFPNDDRMAILKEWIQMDVSCFAFIELNFWDAANKEQTEHFRVMFPEAKSRPIDAEPTYDARIDINKYLPTAKDGWDKVRMTEAVKAIQTDLLPLVRKLHEGEK